MTYHYFARNPSYTFQNKYKNQLTFWKAFSFSSSLALTAMRDSWVWSSSFSIVWIFFCKERASSSAYTNKITFNSTILISRESNKSLPVFLFSVHVTTSYRQVKKQIVFFYSLLYLIDLFGLGMNFYFKKTDFIASLTCL